MAQDVHLVPGILHGVAQRLWVVNINNGQRQFVVDAPTAGDACSVAGAHWRADPTVNSRQRARGIYDLRVSEAKFGEVRSQAVIPWKGDLLASWDSLTGDD